MVFVKYHKKGLFSNTVRDTVTVGVIIVYHSIMKIDHIIRISNVKHIFFKFDIGIILFFMLFRQMLVQCEIK